MITTIFLPNLTYIETKEELLSELKHLKEVYLRLKEKYYIKILTRSKVYGESEVTDFKRFLLDGVTREGFILEGEFPPIDGIVHKRIFFSLREFQRRINRKIDPRAEADDYCKKLVRE